MTGNRKGSPGTRDVIMRYDVGLLFGVLFLVGIGIVMVYSASWSLAREASKPEYYYLRRQAIFGITGIAVLIFFRQVPYRLYRYFTYPALLIAMGCLIAIQTSGLGISSGGSARWLRLGGFSFQPSELARFVLVIYLAYSISKKEDRIKEFRIGFLPHVLVMGALMVPIFMQPDFGSIVILWAITWLMLYIGGVRLGYLLASLLFLLPLAYYLVVSADYRIRRIIGFLDPWQYPADEGYQIVHSLMAFGSGRTWGAGIGQGYQKLFYLPEPHTDFIFSVIGEELGLVGVMAILGLYAMILWRGVDIARHARDRFGSLLAIGLTVSISLQVCVNVGVSLGLLPPKGLTLPFLSYGGTSLLLSMASIGVLMNIAASRAR